ncbi:hypothetical protein MPER_15955, partial [Moniliophthora perniciosa FA553]
MPRPRLYHTPQEKKIANRQKALKSYYKNREIIAERRRSKSAHSSSSQPAQNADLGSAPLPQAFGEKDGTKETRRLRQMDTDTINDDKDKWERRASKVERKLSTILLNTQSNRDYCDLLSI